MTLADDIAGVLPDLANYRGAAGGQVSNAAIAALLALIYNTGGTGGGGGATAAEVKTAIETATNLDTIETLLTLTKGAGNVDSTTLRATIASDGVLLTLLQARLPAQPTVARYLGSSAGANVKNAAGKLLGISCTNLNASNRYFQLFNNTTGPSGTPLISYPIYGGGGFLVLGNDYFAGSGVDFSVGISWGFSTASGTYTAGTSTDCIAEVFYT